MKKIIVAILFELIPLISTPFNISDAYSNCLTPINEKTCYEVTYYDLQIAINIESRSISGSNTIYFKVENDFKNLQINLFNNLKIDSIIWEEKKICYTRDSNNVYIYFPQTLKKDSLSLIQIFYHGSPIVARKAPWDGGFVWSKDSLNNDWVGVACEGEGASLWWPTKDDLSDKPDSVRISVTCPHGLSCISNGNLEKIDKATNTFTWKVSYPINSYNVTVNIGAYDHFSDHYKSTDGSILQLDYYVLSYNLEKAKAHFEQVKKILKVYEYYFGKYPFPKDGYALVETSYWGMEHQSCIAYGNKFKNDVGLFDFIIFHETAHEWWGNNITASDLGELWIHEAFATYAEVLLIEYYYGKEASSKYLNYQKNQIENKNPLLLPFSIGYFNPDDTDIYYKGSWMLHTIRNAMDDDKKFFGVLKMLNEKYRHSIITTQNIIDLFNAHSKTNLSPIFKQYLEFTKIPILQYHIHKKNKKQILSMRWITDVEGFEMPVFIKVNGKVRKILVGNNKNEIKIQSDEEPVILNDLQYILLEKVPTF